MAEIEKIEKTDGRDKNGGRRPGSGRKPKTPNKVSPELRALAREYTETALETLVSVATDTEAPPAARVMASNALLDRGHGKPVQAIEGTGEGGAIIVEIVRFSKERGNAKD